MVSLNQSRRPYTSITFDVDMVDYLNESSHFDEIKNFFEPIKEVLEEFPRVRTTWFIRIDRQIEVQYGKPDFVFQEYPEVIKWLTDNGHEIGWHHHAYKQEEGLWTQETNPNKVKDQLIHYGNLASKLGITSARMGWSWHTNETMNTLDYLGFKVDSSAVPRPKYPWEKAGHDWSKSSSQPYKPSCHNYQIRGHPSLEILEIPISVTKISAPSDDRPMQRYMNIAYKPHIFSEAFQHYQDKDCLVTITHPYELMQNKVSHDLLAFDMEALSSNLRTLEAKKVEFVTIKELSTHY